MSTSYPLKVQAIRSQGQQPRLYVTFPLALAAAIGLEPGETVQWELLERGGTAFGPTRRHPAHHAPSRRQEVMVPPT